VSAGTASSASAPKPSNFQTSVLSNGRVRVTPGQLFGGTASHQP
jgi:hypothetical protein